MADSAVYRLMADGIYSPDTLVYRVLIPFIAKYSPLPNSLDFYLISAICTVVIIYTITKVFAEWLPPKEFVFLWLQSGFCFWSFYDCPETDTFAFACWCLAYRYRSRLILTAIILVIGTAARESTLFIVPFLMFADKKIMRHILSAVPAVAVFFLIRQYVNGSDYFGYYFNNQLGFYLYNFFDPHWIASYLTVFGFAPVVILCCGEKIGVRREFLLMLFFVFITCLVAGGIDRFIFMLFPFVLIPAGVALNKTSDGSRVVVLSCFIMLTAARFFFIKYWYINEWYEVAVYSIILSLPLAHNKIFSTRP